MSPEVPDPVVVLPEAVSPLRQDVVLPEDDAAKDDGERGMQDDAARIAELTERVAALEAERADLLDRLAVIHRASDTPAA